MLQPHAEVLRPFGLLFLATANYTGWPDAAALTLISQKRTTWCTCRMPRLLSLLELFVHYLGISVDLNLPFL